MKEKIISVIKADDYSIVRTLFECKEIILPEDYEGSQNIILYSEIKNEKVVLRFSYRIDRNESNIKAELEFINYLFTKGVNVCKPLLSKNAKYIEGIVVGKHVILCVAFERAMGDFLCSRGYRYRDNVDIVEYYYNYGRTLGQLHKATIAFGKDIGMVDRPIWLEHIEKKIVQYVPTSMGNVKEAFFGLTNELRKRTTNSNEYGLIHNDFCDGNFTIDYTNGSITVFDFDDSAYNWFMYDIADAWTKGVGWAMYESKIDKRKEIMAKWFNNVMSGYYSIVDTKYDLDRDLVFFIQVVQMETFLDELRYQVDTTGEMDMDREMLFKKKCIEEGIEYLGFYETYYSHKYPFELILNT